MNDKNITIIKPKYGWQVVNLNELWNYRDLFYFIVYRDIKTRYAQSILGVGWAVIQPLFSMIVFTIIFGKLAKINSDGVPYFIFSYTALVPWTYFSSALAGSSSSLVGSSNMIKKIYFPRIVIPLAPVISKLIDFSIAFVLLIAMMIYMGYYPGVNLVFLPILILLMMLTSSGIGMILTALAVQYRDVNYGTGFLIQLMMYGAPVIYPASNIPEKFTFLYGFFPMVAVIEGFRAILLKTRAIPWDFIYTGYFVAIIIFIYGSYYFKKMERYFSDVA